VMAWSSVLPAVALLAYAPPRALLRGTSVVSPRSAVACCTASTVSFDEALAGVLSDAASKGSMEAALDPWLDRLDETFLPTLASKIEVAPDAELPLLNELMAALQQRSQTGFERARDQLQALLGAGEINRMDAQLAGMVKRNEVDAGLFYVILRNMQDAQDAGDDGGVRLLAHLHTRLQEELEKKTEPALALLHKLTRTDGASIRQNILRHNLVQQTSTLLPDGSTLPLTTPAPAMVEPMSFAQAVEAALDKVLSLPIERAAIESTAEEIREVAKEARMVVAEAYPAETLDAFTDALTPAFARALPQRRPEPTPNSEPRLMEEDDS